MTQKQKILVVEDEIKIQGLIRDILIDDYDVLLANTGEEGVALAREEHPDLIILDILMPKMDGILACKFLRKALTTKNIPIIMLTALKDSSDRIQAFKAGADDYLSKPFDPDELIARIESKISRFKTLQKSQPLGEIERGNLKMNLLTRQVYISGREVHLTVLEFDILKNLLEAQGTVRSRKDLIEAIWEDSSIPSRVLDSHILSIRRKVSEFDHRIETIYGCGYVIRELPSKGPWADRTEVEEVFPPK